MKLTPSGLTIIGVPVYTMGSNLIKGNDNVYDLTDEIHKALSSTGYSDKTMKKESDLCLNNNKNYIGSRGIGDRPSVRKTFLNGFA